MSSLNLFSLRQSLLLTCISFMAAIPLAQAQELAADGFVVPKGVPRVKSPWTDLCNKERDDAFKACVSDPETEKWVMECAKGELKALMAFLQDEGESGTIDKPTKDAILKSCLRSVKIACDEVADEARKACVEREKVKYLPLT